MTNSGRGHLLGTLNNTYGLDGFSPIIEVLKDTDTEYVLHITTKTDSFETPNLKSGIHMTNAEIDEEGHLIITLSTGQTLDGGYVKGEDGETPEFEVGSVSVALPGQNPSVKIRGEAPNYILDFTLPDSSSSVLVDDQLSLKSENPVQNRVITAALQDLSQPASDKVMGLVKGSATQNGIVINPDGTMTVHSISISKIYQNPDESIVFVCGDST